MIKGLITGNVGQDLVLRETKTGRKVTNISLGVNVGMDKPAIWIDCAIWGDLALHAIDKVKKGDRVQLFGTFEDKLGKKPIEKDGQKGFVWVIERKLTVSDIQMISRKRTEDLEVDLSEVDFTPIESDAADHADAPDLDAVFAAAQGSSEEQDDISF